MEARSPSAGAPDADERFPARVEWRTRGKGDDTLIYVEEYGEVMKVWKATPELLTDFLNKMDGWRAPEKRLETEMDQRDPDGWGKLAMSRAQDGGQVLDMDPEAYWDGIYYWFRSRGTDPHPWRGRAAWDN